VQRPEPRIPQQRQAEDQATAKVEVPNREAYEKLEREAAAAEISKEYVLRFLKHPDDASFGFWSAPEVKANPQHDTFLVSSTVKAKNDFGAELTYRWETIVTLEGNTLNLVRCVIDDNEVYASAELLDKLNAKREEARRAEALAVEQEKADADRARKAELDAEKWRNWTDVSGKFTTEAKYGGVAFGQATLIKRDGKKVQVPLERLSNDDQKWISDWNQRSRAGGKRFESRNGASSAEVVRVRLVPFENRTGLRSKMVLVDWKNTGTTAIRAVDVDIIPYDARGNRLEAGRKNQPIYAVSNSSPGIAPGETYREPDDEGFILDAEFAAMIRRVEVKITEVVEVDAY
jgi:hypothetical protein